MASILLHLVAGFIPYRWQRASTMLSREWRGYRLVVLGMDCLGGGPESIPLESCLNDTFSAQARLLTPHLALRQAPLISTESAWPIRVAGNGGRYSGSWIQTLLCARLLRRSRPIMCSSTSGRSVPRSRPSGRPRSRSGGAPVPGRAIVHRGDRRARSGEPHRGAAPAAARYARPPRRGGPRRPCATDLRDCEAPEELYLPGLMPIIS